MYYFLLLPLYLIAILPSRFKHGLSDFISFLLFRFFHYRENVIKDNVEKAFPNLNPKEISKIISNFHKAFCDQWLETISLLTMSKEKIEKTLVGQWGKIQEAVENSDGKVIVLLGHQFNWEFANVASPLHFKVKYVGIYLPISSNGVDKILKKIRERTGGLLISSKAIRQGLQSLKGSKYVLGFVADQTPPTEKTSDWHLFFDRPTPFLTGPFKIAQAQQATVLFAGLHKIKRGQYQLTVEPICENAALFKREVLIQKYVELLEASIRKQPENWLWSHRRWKHELPKEKQIYREKV